MFMECLKIIIQIIPNIKNRILLKLNTFSANKIILFDQVGELGNLVKHFGLRSYWYLKNMCVMCHWELQTLKYK